jgi:hypothetical protein
MKPYVPPPRKRRETTPSQLPIDEQHALFYEIQQKRDHIPPMPWKGIADELGFAPRTLEYFNKAMEKREENRDTRSMAEIWDERMRMARQPSPDSPDPRAGQQDAQDETPGSEEDGHGIQAEDGEQLITQQRLAAERRRAVERNAEPEAMPDIIRQLVAEREQLEAQLEAAQVREDALRNAMRAQWIRAQQVVAGLMEQVQEAAVRREEEGLPPDDYKYGEPSSPRWDPPMP